jgi:hypothetical protein
MCINHPLAGKFNLEISNNHESCGKVSQFCIV